MNNIANWILLGVQVLSTTVVGIIGYFLKSELAKAEKMVNDLSEFKTTVALNYVRKDDYNRTTGEINAKLDKIYDLLIERGRLNG